MAPITMSAPVLGALTVRKISAVEILGLALIGLCAHIFGFILNDLVDIDVDRKVPYRQHSPLLTGEVKAREAWVFAGLQIPLAFFIYMGIFSGNAYGGLALVVSVLLSIVYGLWSKFGEIPKWIPEISLAGSIGFLSLAGVLFGSLHVKPVSILFCLALTIGLLLLNSVPSGLKDLRTDVQSKVESFIIWAGARLEANGVLIIPKKLFIYSFSLHFLFGCALFQIALDLKPPLWVALWSFTLYVYSGLHLRALLSPLSVINKTPSLLSGVFNYFSLTLLLINQISLTFWIVLFILSLVPVSQPITLAYKMWKKKYGLIMTYNASKSKHTYSRVDEGLE